MLKWYRNRIMLNETLEQNKNELQKYKNDKIVALLKDESNLIQDHLELLDENEKLKKYKAFYEFIYNRFFIDLIEREDGSFKIGFEPKEPIQDQPRFTEVDYLLGNLLNEVLGNDINK